MTHGYPHHQTNRMLMVILAFWALFSGCATLGKDECLNADWLTIGYEDGARGYPASRIGSHREACAKHGVTADFDRYERGRLEGLGEFCTPQRGYGLGAAGKRYGYVCPDNLEPAFLDGYRQGKIVYAAQVAVNKQAADLKKMYADLDAVEQQLSSHEAELIREGVGPRRRKYLLEEIKILSDDQRFMVTEVAEQEALLEASKENLKEIIAQNPY